MPPFNMDLYECCLLNLYFVCCAASIAMQANMVHKQHIRAIAAVLHTFSRLEHAGHLSATTQLDPAMHILPSECNISYQLTVFCTQGLMSVRQAQQEV